MSIKTTPLKICELNQINDGESEGFTIEINGIKKHYIVIRKKQHAFVYLNSCPHIGSPLDFIAGRFLTPDKKFIICSTHGALFRINDGFCISGPCAEKTLQSIPVKILNGDIFLIQE